MSCLFCKIVNKEISNYTVFEDENVLAFLDIFPCSEGHTVLIPKKHGEVISDFSDKEIAELFAAVPRITKKLQEKLGVSDFNIGWNHGTVGGQAVPHLHIHIIPRRVGDGGTSMHGIVKNPGRPVAEVLQDLQ